MAKERQHYVPRFYLDSFCDDEGHLYVYDKTTSRTFTTRPESIAAEKDFYQLPVELTGTGDARELEMAMSDVEGDAAKIIRTWVRTTGSPDFCVTSSEKQQFALYIALQLLRTREQREILSEFQRRTLASNQTRVEDSKLHNHLLWNSDLVQEFADQLSRFIWIIARNSSKIQFLTSDHPVVVKDSTNTNWLLAPRIFEAGVQIILPLTPTLILYCKEPKHWEAVSRFDSMLSPVTFTDYMVHHENSGQIGMSTRFIISSSTAFSIINEYCNKNPEIRDPSRERFTQKGT